MNPRGMSNFIRHSDFAVSYARSLASFNATRGSVALRRIGDRIMSEDKLHGYRSLTSLSAGADLIGERNEFVNGDSEAKVRLWQMFTYGDLLNHHIGPNSSDKEAYQQTVDSLADVYHRFTAPTMKQSQELVMAPEPELIKAVIMEMPELTPEPMHFPARHHDFKVNHRLRAIAANLRDDTKAVDKAADNVLPVLKSVNKNNVIDPMIDAFVQDVIKAIELKQQAEQAIVDAGVELATSISPDIGNIASVVNDVSNAASDIKSDIIESATDEVLKLSLDNLEPPEEHKGEQL